MQELTWKVSIDPAIAQAAMRELASTAKSATADIEASVRKEAQAAIGLQKQRSAALIAQWKADTKANEQELKQRTADELRAASQTAANHIQLARQVGDSSKLVENAVDELSSHLNLFIGERIPLLGHGFVRISDNLRSLHVNLQPVEGSVLKLGSAINDLSSKSNKSADDIKGFLETYAKLGTQAEKDEAAISFFGASLAQKLTPALNSASTEMTALASGGEAAGGSIAAIAGPVAIAVAAVGALVAIEYELIKTTYEANQAFAEEGEKLKLAQDQTKLTVEQIEALQIAGGKANISVDEISLTLGRYLAAVGKAQREGSNSQLAKEFEDLGIDITKLGDDPVKAIDALFGAFDRLGPSIKENQAATELLNRNGIRMISVFRESGGSIAELTDKTKALRIWTQDYLDQAEKENAALHDLSKAWSNLKIGLGEAITPDAIEFFKELTTAVNENKEGIKLLFDAASWLITGDTVKGIFRDLKDGAHDLNELAKAWEWLAGKTKTAYDWFVAYSQLSPTALPAPPAAPSSLGAPASAESQKKPAESSQQTLPATDSAERLSQFKTAYDSTKEAVASAIAQIQSLDKRGHESSGQALREVLVNYGLRSAAAKQYFDEAVTQKQAEYEANKGSVSRQREINDEIAKLNGERLKDEEETNKGIVEAQNRFYEQQRADATRQIQLRADLDAEIENRAIAAAHARRARNEINAKEEADEVAKHENNIFTIKRDALKKELADPNLGQYENQRKELSAQLKKLEEEHTSALAEQADKQKAISIELVEERLRILQTSSQQELSVQTAADETAIIRAKANAAARVITERQAAEEIIKIRLAAIQRELDINDKLGKVVDTIDDPKKKKELRERLSTDDKLLFETRKQIQIEGNQDFESADKADLQRQNEYQQAYARLLLSGLKSDEEISRLRIEFLRTIGASRIQILRAELAQRTDANEKQHAQELIRLKEEYDAAVKSAKNMQERLAALKQYHDDVEKENARFKGEGDLIGAQGGPIQKVLRPASLSSILGSNTASHIAEIRKQLDLTGKSASNLSVVFKGVGESIKDNLEDRIAQLPSAMDLLNGAIDQEIQGVGALVNQWVLYGSVGPDALRKVTAQVLASLAEQATVEALYYTAAGIVDLFVDPAQAAADFTAAGIWAGIAGGAGLAGRGIAGNSFQQKPAGATGSAGSSRSSSSSSSSQANSQPQPIVLGSQRQTVTHDVVVTIKAEKGFIAEHVTRELKSNNRELTRAIQNAADRSNGSGTN